MHFHFEQAVVVILIFLCCVYSMPACSRVLARKEVRDLSPAELASFIEAMKELHRKVEPTGLSKFDQYVKMHYEAGKKVHGYHLAQQTNTL